MTAPQARGVREPTAPGEDAPTGTDSGSSGQSLLKRIIIYIPGSVIPSVLALATSIIFTRIFSPVEFGKYSLFLVYAAPIELLAVAWLDQSIGKFLPTEQTSEGRRLVKDAIFLSIGLIFFIEIVLGVVFFAVGSFLLASGWRSFLLPTFLFVIVSSLFDVLIIVFAVEARAKEYTSYRLFDGVTTFALRILLVSAIFSMDIRLMFWSIVISHCFLLPVMWVRGGFPPPQRIVRVLRSSEIRSTARAFLVFGLPMTIFFFSSVLLDVGDRYVLNFLMGPGPVGVYDANYRLIAGLAPLMMVPITITLHPYLMRIAGSGDIKHVEQVIGNVIENLLLVGALTVGLTFLLHQLIARVLLGHEFRAGSVIMPAVVAGVFLFNIGTFAHKPFEIMGRTRVMLVFAVIAAAANIGFCFALIPLMGYVGAAYATFLSYALYTVCVGYLGRRIFRWRVKLRRLAIHGGIIASGVAAIYLVRDAMTGLAYGWSLAMTIVASCALASVSLLSLLRGLLSPSWSTSPAEPRRLARSSPLDFLRRRPPGRHRRDHLRDVPCSESLKIPTGSGTATRTTPAAPSAARWANTQIKPGCSPPSLRSDVQKMPSNAPSKTPNETRPSPDPGISRSSSADDVASAVVSTQKPAPPHRA